MAALELDFINKTYDYVLTVRLINKQQESTNLKLVMILKIGLTIVKSLISIGSAGNHDLL